MATPAESPHSDRRHLVRIAGWLVVLALFVVFLVQNARSVHIRFLFWQGSTSLSWALLIAGVLGLVLGLVLPRLRRVLRALSGRDQR